MQLHPILPDDQIPAALRKPLRFGDPEQIMALYQLDAKIEELDAIADAEGADISALKKFKVRVTVESEFDIEVVAVSKAHAEELAEEEVSDMSPHDFDLEISYYARAIKPKATPTPN